MGLRINTNISSLDALRNLQLSDRAQQQSLTRLSSGLRINSGADDPSGLVISNRLGLQIAALQQDSANSQNGANLIATADDALQKVNDLLVGIQKSVQFALSTGSNSPDQIAAEQASVDQSIAAIDRIAATTRYGDRQLLNGSSAYQLNGVGVLSSTEAAASATGFTDINIQSLRFAGTNNSRTISLQVTQDARRADFVASGVGTTGAAATLRITGNRGSAQIVLAQGSSATQFTAAINAVSDQTGVFAQSSVAGSTEVLSETLGSGALAKIDVVAGTLSGTLIARSSTDVGTAFTGVSSTNTATGGTLSNNGVDAKVSFNGLSYTGQGVAFNINSGDAQFSFNLNKNLYDSTLVGGGTLASITASTQATATITVLRTGLEFQVRENNTSNDRLAVGIASARSADLGTATSHDLISEATNGGNFAATVTQGGFLASLISGQGNDLTQNASNAQTISKAAADQVSKLRGFIGAVESFNLQPNVDSIAVATQNLQSSQSAIKDLDFAAETANFTRTQILFQSGIAALASAKTIPQSVLTLLR